MPVHDFRMYGLLVRSFPKFLLPLTYLEVPTSHRVDIFVLFILVLNFAICVSLMCLGGFCIWPFSHKSESSELSSGSLRSVCINVSSLFMLYWYHLRFYLLSLIWIFGVMFGAFCKVYPHAFFVGFVKLFLHIPNNHRLFRFRVTSCFDVLPHI